MEERRIIATDNVLFRKLVEYSHEGISLIDRNFKVIYRSPSAKRVNGYGEIDSHNNNLTEIIHPDDIDKVLEILSKLLKKTAQSITSSFRCKHADGHFIWLECTYTNMFHEPEINAIVCNFRDISHQKKSEELLQQSIKELSAYKYALDEADIVAITDQKGTITHVNDNFCKISKYSREELIGQDHRIINSSFHSKAFIRNLWTTIAGGKIWKNEMKNKAKDGTYYWVDTTIIPFLNEKGKPYQYVAIRSDITERKLFEEKIIESERFTKTVTDNLPPMIAYWTAELFCKFANKAMLDWFELTSEQMLGINKKALMEENEFELYRPFITNVLNGKSESFERSLSKKNGQVIFTHTQYVPDIQNGKVIGFYSLIYDYSEMRMAELEVIEKTAQINNLLENITDGFIALDEHRCYIYANKQIGKMLGVSPSSLIGKNIWELFPDVVGSPTYIAIEEAFRQHTYICNEDYYQPLQLWQENRVYPSGNGLSIFIRDISERKQQEAQKLLLASISQVFNEETELNRSLCNVLELLVDFLGFAMAEAWLIEADSSRISRVANFTNEGKIGAFFEAGKSISFNKGEGLPGSIWKSEKKECWELNNNPEFVRADAAKKVGLKVAYGSPLFYQGKIIGVLVLGTTVNKAKSEDFPSILENIGTHLGSEIKRKQLEQELNQVFNFTPDILCTASIDGYFKKVNPAMSIILEYNEEELLSKPFMDFVYLLDKEATAIELQNIINGKPTYYIENRYITKSGKIKWLAWTTTAASEQGILYCSAKDITEKKQLEELLHKATNLARIGAWEVDLLTQKVHWSEMTKEIHETEPGFVPDIEAGINFYREGESRDKISLKIRELIETGNGFDVELQIVTVKGNLKWIRVVGEAEFSENKCIRLYGSFQDIDTLKRTEIIAKEILEERNNILESIGDAFFAVDKDWMVTYWNSTAEQVLQKTKEEMINQNLWAIFSGSVNSLSYLKYHQAVELNQAMHFEDYHPVLNKWYEISAYPTGNGLSIYFKDITARKTSELLLKDLNTSLQKQAKELAISNTELEQFAYVASHDLQEPLRMITSFLTQLELKYENVVDEKGKKYIHFAVDGAKRMRQIILDLLEFSRVGKLGNNKEHIDIKTIIKDVLVLYRKQIEEQHAKISYTNMPTLFTYKAPIRQIFQNLIGNSLKYHAAGTDPRIRISCEEVGDFWKFAITDNGIGINKDYFDKIFIIFQRLHNKDEYAGTGMGLAITKKIIENMGGQIWLESEEDKGSTFYFTILNDRL